MTHPLHEPGRPLTERQREVLDRYMQGMMIKNIAQELHASTSTVSTHLRQICRKLGVNQPRDLLRLSRPDLNVSAELCRLRAEVESLEAWRRVMNREINLVTAQRDEYFRQLQELRGNQEVPTTH